MRRCLPACGIIDGKVTFQATLDPSHPPDRAALAARLGKAAPIWELALASVIRRVPQVAEAWHFAGPKTGWSLRLVEGDRILVYLTPGEGAFRVGLVLGAKSVNEARESGLSDAAAAILDASKKNAEGYGVRFEVASRKELAPFEELLAIKLTVPGRRRRDGRMK